MANLQLIDYILIPPNLWIHVYARALCTDAIPSDPEVSRCNQSRWPTNCTCFHGNHVMRKESISPRSREQNALAGENTGPFWPWEPLGAGKSAVYLSNAFYSSLRGEKYFRGSSPTTILKDFFRMEARDKLRSNWAWGRSKGKEIMKQSNIKG